MGLAILSKAWSTLDTFSAAGIKSCHDYHAAIALQDIEPGKGSIKPQLAEKVFSVEQAFSKMSKPKDGSKEFRIDIKLDGRLLLLHPYLFSGNTHSVGLCHSGANAAFHVVHKSRI